jgi:hypothetical protein
MFNAEENKSSIFRDRTPIIAGYWRRNMGIGYFNESIDNLFENLKEISETEYSSVFDGKSIDIKFKIGELNEDYKKEGDYSELNELFVAPKHKHMFFTFPWRNIPWGVKSLMRIYSNDTNFEFLDKKFIGKDSYEHIVIEYR